MRPSPHCPQITFRNQSPLCHGLYHNHNNPGFNPERSLRGCKTRQSMHYGPMASLNELPLTTVNLSLFWSFNISFRRWQIPLSIMSGVAFLLITGCAFVSSTALD